jgi:DNA-binding HxlR family transcriptional regulator
LKSKRYEHLCPHFQAAMEILARPWTGLIIATLWRDQPLRFSELRKRLSAMGDRMLSARLRELEARGIVARHVEPGPPVRVAYALTDVGRGFKEVSLAISGWGMRFTPAAAKGAKPPAPVKGAKPATRPRSRAAGKSARP